MLIGNLPEDTSISEDGYVIYSEDGTHLSKMKIKNLNGGGAGLKYWKETENSLYRVQHNEGQWLFDDHFKVPGAAEIIVAATHWDFSDGGADRDISDPILIGHEDPETHEQWYTEEDGPEVAQLQGRVKHYYIFRRISNKVVMGGTLWYKYWGGAQDSRLPDEQAQGISRYLYNLPGWLLMSTDKDTLTYQMVEIDPWSYDIFPQSIQERIDDGFFRYEHMAEKTISTIAPLETTFTHPATGAVFYINGMPDPEIYEPLHVQIDPINGYYNNCAYNIFYAYQPPSGLDPSSYPYGDSINLYTGNGSHFDFPYMSAVNSSSSSPGWSTWTVNDIHDPIGTNHHSYDDYKNVRFAAYDGKLADLNPGVTKWVGDPALIKGPYLAYFGAVNDYDGILYDTSWGKTAIQYPFHDGNILYPQGYFTGMSTGFDADAKGKIFYSGTTNDDYDTPQVDQSNFYIDINGNIFGNDIDAAGIIKSNNNPVIDRVTPLLSQGTKIANLYLSGESSPVELYAPEGGGGGGGGVNITATRIWKNPKSGYQAQVSTITLDSDPGNYDILMIDFRNDYGSASKSLKYYNFMSCAGFLGFGSVDCYGEPNNNCYVTILGGFQSGTLSYTPDYGGNAMIKQIIGIKFS